MDNQRRAHAEQQRLRLTIRKQCLFADLSDEQDRSRVQEDAEQAEDDVLNDFLHHGLPPTLSSAFFSHVVDFTLWARWCKSPLKTSLHMVPKQLTLTDWP